MGACEGMTITDPELLMRVMEAREEVEEAGDDQAQLQPLLDNMRGLHASTVQVRRAGGRFGSGYSGVAAGGVVGGVEACQSCLLR